MTYWLISNSKAGDGKRGRDFWLAALARAGICDPECVDFSNLGWAKQIQPGDVLLVAGGDGSVNTGARLCLDNQATLAVLPSGTANDFARNLNLPEQPDPLCALIAEGKTQKVDVAEYGQNLFLNVAHIGLGTLPVREAEPTEKKLFGRFSYGLQLLRKLNARRGFKAEIRCGEGYASGRWLSIAIACGAFFGGGNEIPEAAANDGLLNVIAVKPRSIPQLLLAFLQVRFNRRVPKSTRTLVRLRGQTCTIHTSRHKTVTADGDEAGTTPLTVNCRPGCLSVIGQTIIRTGRSADGNN
ncbi:MAG TPA: diacylglycerol kinase family protein [Marinobacter sp.]|nr:diacylglycerol kinase family protein [Marinobacter sp.]